jgi:cytochrome c oxidase cbb3-type subunit 3
MDNKWTYGERPEQIFSTIVQDRPNGMLSFGGRIPENHIWELVAYVRSMGGMTPQDAAPGRSDEMKNSPPPSSAEQVPQMDSSAPPASEAPQ